MERQMTDTWNGYAVGDKVVMLVETMGCTPDDEEVIYSSQSAGEIVAVEDFGPVQGRGVEVAIGESDRAIIQVFDDRDVSEAGGVVWFRKAG
jgi:hypothetical protein